MTALFNTKTGIEGYLKSLSGLNDLAHDRREASKSGWHLNEFCVLGRFFLDSCGNCSPIIENIPAEMFRVNKYEDPPTRVPQVMTRDELDFFMRGEMFSYSSGTAFPPEYATCEICKSTWTIENCHDIIVDQKTEKVEADSFMVGKPLKDIKQLFQFAGRIKHFVDSDQIAHLEKREESREIPIYSIHCGLFLSYVPKDYVLKSGDYVFVQQIIFTHEACHRKKLFQDVRKETIEAFTNAGYPNVNLITIPNEYHGGQNGRKVPYYATPWYLVQVDDGPVFKIGWRKSVINIEWKDTGKRLPDLFADQETTKDDFLVHAHGYKKATEYLKKLIPALENA